MLIISRKMREYSIYNLNLIENALTVKRLKYSVFFVLYNTIQIRILIHINSKVLKGKNIF